MDGGERIVTKDKALHAWFSSFGIPAYTSASVPQDVAFPWITYDLVTGAWEEGEVGLTVNIWYYTESEAIPNAKAAEISKAIGLGGVTIPCDEGMIWIKRGSPFCQSLYDESDRNIKRRYLNITAEFETLY